VVAKIGDVRRALPTAYITFEGLGMAWPGDAPVVTALIVPIVSLAWAAVLVLRARRVP